MDIKHALVWTFFVVQELMTVRCQFNPPSIPSDMPTYFSLLENTPVGTEIFLLRATDPDLHDVLTFRTSTSDTTTLVSLSSTTFNTSLNQWACKVFLNALLDRDTSPTSRELYFSLTDGQSRVYITIIMIILDVNDNPPMFTNLPYRTSIPENQPVGSWVFNVTATDPDSGPGGNILYSMKSTPTDYNQTFSLHAVNGVITLYKPLDYETQSFYHFNVSAKDEGDPPCPGDTCLCQGRPELCDPGPVDLFITIIDVQDTPPIFERLPYIRSVPENETIGYSVLQVIASDGDRGVSEPNDVRFSFTGGDLYNFTISETDGTVSVNGILDADAEEIRDRGGLCVFTVTATEVPKPGSAPTLNPNNQSSTQVSITVTDVNDNPPVFTASGSPLSSFTASVLENTPSGVPVTASSVIEVFDRDQGINSRFWIYLEKDGAAYQDFALLPKQNSVIQGRSTVTIMVANTSVLDYETTKTISFKLIAEENNSNPNIRNSSEITVTVNIEDTNDNSPYFPEQPFMFNVSEDANLGHVIGNVTASDKDSGEFGRIIFSLEDGQNGEFNISKEGQIQVAKQLDRETHSVYSLAVVAEDNPSAPENQRRRTTRRFQILVLDVNDHYPMWTQVIPYISVLETTSVGTNITEMKATDFDEGLNAQIEYSIAPGTNGSDLFEVVTNKDVAVIRVKQKLIDNTGLRLVQVVATDKGTPPLNSSYDLSVFVIDENQHKPIFVQPNQTIYETEKIPEIWVEEEQPVGTALYTLLAIDHDEGENGRVEYYLNPPTNGDYDYFRIPRDGTLLSTRRLDRESKDVFEIQIRAEDNGKPAALSTIMTIKIRLMDINDNEPSYKSFQMPQVLHVLEERSNIYIGQIEPAFDPDLDPYNKSCYYFYGSGDVSGLYLDKMTGNLSLIKKVDREAIDTLDLVIKASENCSLASDFYIFSQNKSFVAEPSLKNAPLDYNSSDDSLLWVEVKIDDINDNPPHFIYREFSASVIFDVDIETEVLSLAMSITDKDTPVNRKNMFKSLSITPVLENGEGLDTTREPFLVSVNGSISTNIHFRPNLLGYFLLKVMAYDTDGMNDTADVRVYLIANLQRVKLVFNLLPNQVEEIKNAFVKSLSDILNIDLVINKIQSHTNSDGTRDPSKTDAFIHGMYRKTQKLVPASELWQMFDKSQAARAFLYVNGVIAAQPLTEEKVEDKSEEERRIFAVIVAVLSVIAIALLLVLIHLVRLYRRRLRAATTMAYVSPKEKTMFEHPGTNKYFAAENPLFGKEIKQAVVDDDKTSNNSLDLNEVDRLATDFKSAEANEEQEMVMNIVDSSDGVLTNDVSHSAPLDQVLHAYSNTAFENEEEDDSYETVKRRGGGVHSSSSPYGLLFIPGMGQNVHEGVTRFTDEIVSNDSGLSDTNLRHTDI